jgi:hypothetical protein
MPAALPPDTAICQQQPRVAGRTALASGETTSELDNRGFNLYRGTSPDGWDRQLNSALIPSQSQSNPGGFIYTWLDDVDLVPGVTYYLQRSMVQFVCETHRQRQNAWCDPMTPLTAQQIQQRLALVTRDVIC